MRLPVETLLGTTKASAEVKNFLKDVKEFYNHSVNGKHELFIDSKVFPDAFYFNCRALGLSFCFDKVGVEDTESSYTLAAIHVFREAEGYSCCPFSLPMDISLDWKAREFVQKFGEPQKKTGGGFTPISITYTTTTPKVEIDFLSGNWSDPYNSVAIEKDQKMATLFDIPSLPSVNSIITKTDAPIVDRMRCLFYARHHGGPEAVEVLANVVRDSSVLLAHEAVYLIGQLGEACAVPGLIDLLQDTQNHCMVRHEAAEALAAIGEAEAIPVLERFLSDPSIPVKETCQLALRSLREKTMSENVTAKSKFNTIDPIAQSEVSVASLSLEQLGDCLLDTSRELYERYEALFVLRDLQTPEAYSYITKAMYDTSSALFRHEVAFVLGQIQTPESVGALVSCLKNVEEHPMARHEAALALGSVASCEDSSAGQSERDLAVQTLVKYCEDSEPIVAESCLVALDNVEKETGRRLQDS